jgi:hypothetical protein
VNGTIVNWKVIVGDPGVFDIKVIEHASGGAYTAVDSSFAHTNDTGTQTFASSLRVKIGDLIGITINGSATVKEANPIPGATIQEWNPPLLDGSTLVPVNTYPDSELGYNAVVRYCLVPALKGKKVGFAKTVLHNAGCRTGNVSRSKKGGKFVKAQGVPAGTSLPDQTPVDLKLGPKPKKHKKK